MRTGTTRTPEPARIDKITISDFRGFAGNAIPAITLKGTNNSEHGKNLLLYGENGSGKSTIFTALAELFNPHSVRHFDEELSKPTCLTNRFADMTTTTGRVVVEFTSPVTTAPPVNPMEWRIREPRPADHLFYDKLARTSGFLDYRAILRTHFLDFDNTHINVFSLLIDTILRDIEFPTISVTVGETWTKILDERTRWLALPDQCPRDEDSGMGDPIAWERIGFEPQELLTEEEEETGEYDVDEVYRRFLLREAQDLSDLIRQFQERLAVLLGSLQDKANEYLTEFDGFVSVVLFENADVLLNADPDALLGARHLTNKEWEGRWRIPLRAKFRNIDLEHPGVLLNEARLTAIALTIYLAALKLEVPAAARLSAARLLVLDDVLIGLDMTHRLPVLNLIEKEFTKEKGWQVFLFTFDRPWYEVAKQRLQNTWQRYEIFAVRIGDYEKPVLVPDPEDPLDRARTFLEAGELKAAGVHIRSKFEAVIKSACADFKLPIPYVSDPHAIEVKVLWDTLKGTTFTCTIRREFRNRAGELQRKEIRKRTFYIIPRTLIRPIEHSRSWVMNLLSHDDSRNLYRHEIEDALNAVKTLECQIRLAKNLNGKTRLEARFNSTVTSHNALRPDEVSTSSARRRAAR